VRVALARRFVMLDLVVLLAPILAIVVWVRLERADILEGRTRPTAITVALFRG
jgi:hypothetical protein